MSLSLVRRGKLPEHIAVLLCQEVCKVPGLVLGGSEAADQGGSAGDPEPAPFTGSKATMCYFDKKDSASDLLSAMMQAQMGFSVKLPKQKEEKKPKVKAKAAKAATTASTTIAKKRKASELENQDPNSGMDSKMGELELSLVESTTAAKAAYVDGKASLHSFQP